MKFCTNPTCKQKNPQPFINFNKSKNHKDGYSYYCKTCSNEDFKNRSRIKKIISNCSVSDRNCIIGCMYINRYSISKIMVLFKLKESDIIEILKLESLYEFKVCCRCEMLKSFSEYHKKTKDGTLQNLCNSCISIRNHNDEKLKEYKKRYNLSPVNFDTFAKQIDFAEKVFKTDDGFLQVHCTYCGELFLPTAGQINVRINALIGRSSGEGRLYCSDKCKNECPTYRMQTMDFHKNKNSVNREVQPQLRQLVFLRDNYTCQKCGKHKNELTVGLHCHHLTGVQLNPIESCDIDNCVTVCKICHKNIHIENGCKYIDFKRKNCQ